MMNVLLTKLRTISVKLFEGFFLFKFELRLVEVNMPCAHNRGNVISQGNNKRNKKNHH